MEAIDFPPGQWVLHSSYHSPHSFPVHLLFGVDWLEKWFAVCIHLYRDLLVWCPVLWIWTSLSPLSQTCISSLKVHSHSVWILCPLLRRGHLHVVRPVWLPFPFCCERFRIRCHLLPVFLQVSSGSHPYLNKMTRHRRSYHCGTFGGISVARTLLYCSWSSISSSSPGYK